MNPSTNGTLKFAINIPETIALAYSEGKPVASNFGGDQIMFTLVDGRRVFLPPFVAEKIYKAGIEERQEFTICKREVSHGNRRSIEYQIETGAPVEDAPAQTTKQLPNRSLNSQQHSNGNGDLTGILKASIADVQAKRQPAAPTAGSIADCYRQAIEIALGAMHYAKEEGLLITPGFEDIRCLAATLFISAARGGQ